MGRDPETAGYNFWVNYTLSHGDRGAVAQFFLASPEYRTHFVTSLYTNFLHRSPDAAGLAAYTNLLAINRDELQLVSIMVGSQEYFVLNGNSNASFVNALYRDLFGRSPDTTGAAGWLNLLNQGLSRSQVALDFLLSPEGLNKMVNANWESLSTPTPNAAPGTAQTGSYALATITGNGYGNLFFQGKYTQSEVTTFLNQLTSLEQNQSSDQDAIVSLLASEQYLQNT